MSVLFYFCIMICIGLHFSTRYVLLSKNIQIFPICMFYKKYCDFVFTFLKKSIIILLSIYDKQEA